MSPGTLHIQMASDHLFSSILQYVYIVCLHFDQQHYKTDQYLSYYWFKISDADYFVMQHTLLLTSMY